MQLTSRAGPIWGYGSDERYDGDSLMLTEMRTAMDASPFAGGDGGRKLDLVGFDACLMASLESMTIWSDYKLVGFSDDCPKCWDY